MMNKMRAHRVVGLLIVFSTSFLLALFSEASLAELPTGSDDDAVVVAGTEDAADAADLTAAGALKAAQTHPAAVIFLDAGFQDDSLPVLALFCSPARSPRAPPY